MTGRTPRNLRALRAQDSMLARERSGLGSAKQYVRKEPLHALCRLPRKRRPLLPGRSRQLEKCASPDDHRSATICSFQETRCYGWELQGRPVRRLLNFLGIATDSLDRRFANKARRLLFPRAGVRFLTLSGHCRPNPDSSREPQRVQMELKLS